LVRFLVLSATASKVENVRTLSQSEDHLAKVNSLHQASASILVECRCKPVIKAVNVGHQD